MAWGLKKAVKNTGGAKKTGTGGTGMGFYAYFCTLLINNVNSTNR